MRNSLRILLAIAFVAVAFPAGAASNFGAAGTPTFQGHQISTPASGTRVLYCPSDADDPAYRAAMAVQVNGTVDYFDARFATPSPELLAGYDGVMTWADYPYHDAAGFGDILADYVDQGGVVALGALCAYGAGNHLEGRIMNDTSRYCPVTSSGNHWSLSMWNGTCSGSSLHNNISSYGTEFRDILTLVGPGATVCGYYADGEIANAINAYNDVIYVNGAAGFPASPVGQDAARVGNAILLGAPTPTDPATWSQVKALFR